MSLQSQQSFSFVKRTRQWTKDSKMFDTYTDYYFMVAFLRDHKLRPATTIQKKNYTITFRTVNSKKGKEFGLTVRPVRAEELQRADGPRWHCYEWQSRRGRLQYCVQFLSKRLYWLRALLLRRSASQMNCFQIHPRIPLSDELCGGGKAILLRSIYKRNAEWHFCMLHGNASDCAKAVAPYCDILVEQQRLIVNLPKHDIDGSDFFWMGHAIRTYTLPQLAMIFAQMQLPAYVSLQILSFVIGDSPYQIFFPSEKSLVALFQLARDILAKNHRLPTEKTGLFLLKLWDRASRR